MRVWCSGRVCVGGGRSCVCTRKVRIARLTCGPPAQRRATHLALARRAARRWRGDTAHRSHHPQQRWDGGGEGGARGDASTPISAPKIGPSAVLTTCQLTITDQSEHTRWGRAQGRAFKARAGGGSPSSPRKDAGTRTIADVNADDSIDAAVRVEQLLSLNHPQRRKSHCDRRFPQSHEQFF